MRVIGVANQKGGVGQTARNLSMADEKDIENELDEGSVKGQGGEAMPAAAAPAEEEGAPMPEAIPPEQPLAGESMPEPRDLTPEDIAAMFPTSHADREPPGAGPVDPDPSTPAEPSFTVVETQLEMPATTEQAEQMAMQAASTEGTN